MIFCRKILYSGDSRLKTLLKIKKILTQACVFYTVLITAVYLLGTTLDSSWIPTPAMVAALLIFSAVLAASNAFLFSDKLVFPLRLLLHYIMTSVVFYIVFVLWGGYRNNGGSVLTVLLVYTFAYVLCAVIVGVYRWLTAELRTSHTEYTDVFAEKETYHTMFDGNKK